MISKDEEIKRLLGHIFNELQKLEKKIEKQEERYKNLPYH
jgi:hypothetical protein